MAAPLGTVELPVFIRFDGLEHQVGTVSIDVTTEVTPQVRSAERAIAHALAPCETEQSGQVTVNVFAPQLGDGSEDYVTRAGVPTTPAEAEDVIDRAAAWSDYRNAYGVDPKVHRHFIAGWDAARGTDHAGPLR